MKLTTIILSVGLLVGASTAIGQEPVQIAPQEAPSNDVSNEELEKFAKIYTEVQSESQEMQSEAVTIIESEGMDVDRFNEVANAQNNPSAEVEVKEGEKEKIQAISVKIQKLQQAFQGRVQEMIKKRGLTVQRYQEVYQAIQQDQELQQKLGKMIQG
ncbi:DUF4168 domain-containing protein [Brumimicrobium salinarum]|nr:DUF4168 domain-containing protein [Brumimicrobium salinarum]